MASLALRKVWICSRLSFSASCTWMVNPQHAIRSRLILHWIRLTLCEQAKSVYTPCRLGTQKGDSVKKEIAHAQAHLISNGAAAHHDGGIFPDTTQSAANISGPNWYRFGRL